MNPLSLGKFYRNKLKGVVLIIGTVNVGTEPYKKGYRFVDHRGTFYSSVGLVLNTVFSAFDLSGEVDPLELSEAEMLEIRDAASALSVPGTRLSKLHSGARKLLPVFAGANLAVGVSVVQERPTFGAAAIVIGAIGVAMHLTMPQEPAYT